MRPFPDVESGGRWQISSAGGLWPVWAPDGRQLFYVQPSGMRPGTMMTVPVEAGRTFSAGTPRALFEAAYFPPLAGRSFDLSRDGRRFLMIKAPVEEQVAPPQLVVVLNWIEELKRMAAGSAIRRP